VTTRPATTEPVVPRVRDLRIVLRQTRYALVASLRNSRAVVFGIVFPVILLVLFNSIFSSGDDATVTFHHNVDVRTHAYFTAGLAAYAIMLQSFSTLAIAVTTQRESGQLKRLRGTPMRPWTFIAAQVLRVIIFAIAMVVAMLAIGRIAFQVQLTGSGFVGVAVYVALGTAAMATLGMAITAFTPTVDAASSVGPFGAVILSFISGVFIPVSTLPDWLSKVGQVFPLAPLADGMQRAVTGVRGGTGVTGHDVGLLAIWGAVGLVVAARRFRWVPQGVGT
jgi:ABC-2 type transport system permease protein